MRRNIKNIGHRKAKKEIWRAYDIPYDGKTCVRIIARSKEEAERQALRLCEKVARILPEGI